MRLIALLCCSALGACFGLGDSREGFAPEVSATRAPDTTGARDADTTSGPETGGPQPASANPPASLAACRPSDSEWLRVQTLQRATDDSVHELVACGGAQMSLVRTFMAAILLSNPDAIDLDPDTRSLFESLFGKAASSGFIRDSDGTLLMGQTSPERDLAFAITFEHGDEVVRVDPLMLDSYLVGVRVEAALTHDQMMADMNLDNTYTFTWDSSGPLAHLLNWGEPLPESIVLTFSLWDFVMLYLGSPPSDMSFGPFASLGDIAMASAVTLDDRRNEAVVGYAFSSPRATVSDLGSSRMVAFALDALDAGLEGFELAAATSDLRYSDAARGLAGRLI